MGGGGGGGGGGGSGTGVEGGQMAILRMHFSAQLSKGLILKFTWPSYTNPQSPDGTNIAFLSFRDDNSAGPRASHRLTHSSPAQLFLIARKVRIL